MRIRSLLAALGLLLVLPASSLAATEAAPSGTDRTTEIMFGLILVLMVGLVAIGVLEQRKGH